jgi:hypothetical protein
MENDDDRTQQAHRTSQFPQNTQFLLEEVRPEDRPVIVSPVSLYPAHHLGGSLPDQHTQRTQRRNENRGRKGICCKIGHFTESHCRPY